MVMVCEMVNLTEHNLAPHYAWKMLTEKKQPWMPADWQWRSLTMFLFDDRRWV